MKIKTNISDMEVPYTKGQALYMYVGMSSYVIGYYNCVTPIGYIIVCDKVDIYKDYSIQGNNINSGNFAFEGEYYRGWGVSEVKLPQMYNCINHPREIVMYESKELLIEII